ncbi:hypothetical protein M513_13673 [Trichuris suis]|uniref:Uncharacterized protein n=1 Tax=Trichuris suis TaxID=68888 RepID=A0A085LKF5_9BILA|nr:hypothetical protein M513_13673 [Trichuris suis]
MSEVNSLPIELNNRQLLRNQSKSDRRLLMKAQCVDEALIHIFYLLRRTLHVTTTSKVKYFKVYTFTRLKKKDTNQERKWKRVDPKHTSRKLVQTSRRRSGAKWKQKKQLQTNNKNAEQLSLAPAHSPELSRFTYLFLLTSVPFLTYLLSGNLPVLSCRQFSSYLLSVLTCYPLVYLFRPAFFLLTFGACLTYLFPVPICTLHRLCYPISSLQPNLKISPTLRVPA